MGKKDLMVNIENIGDYIYFIRGHKVMLDQDLAMLYRVETKAVNRVMKRNMDRFPIDFAFELNKKEWEILKYQIGTSRLWGGRRKLPFAFTEQGVAMLSGILRSPQAVSVNIEIMRTFVKLRHILSEHKNLSIKIEELQSFMLKNSHNNDKEFKKVWGAIKKLMTPSDDLRKIGFNLD